MSGIAIGKKIRDLRIKNGLTQEELANRSELSKGFISQLESEQTSPSIATLVDILECLGTNLKDFFNDSVQEKIVFTKDDYFSSEDEGLGERITWIVPNAQKNKMEPILMNLASGGHSDSHDAHEGEEFGFVSEGKIKLTVGKRSFIVEKGETFYFKADKRHSIENVTNSKATVMWISCPPNF